MIKSGAHLNKISNFGDTALIDAIMLKIDCVVLLLELGAKINYSLIGKNYFTNNRGTQSEKTTMVLLLFAAGENLDGKTFMRINGASYMYREKIALKKYLKELEEKRYLKHLCREAVRKQLLDVAPHKNLVYRIKKLGLAKSLVSYLLYDAI